MTMTLRLKAALQRRLGLDGYLVAFAVVKIPTGRYDAQEGGGLPPEERSA